jgi:hypothetical protein
MISYSALKWKLGEAKDVVIKDGKIKYWPKVLGVVPAPQVLDEWQRDYLINLANEKAQKQQAIDFEVEKEREFEENLPSWGKVDTTIETLKLEAEEASTAAMMKPVIISLINVVGKLIRVVYLLARKRLT